MATILFDGVAYGMLLFVLACGLAVTLGLMNFVNLAHGAFAMAGGYVTVMLMDRAGVPFLACLPAAFVVAAALGLVLERTLYRHMYGRSHLEQVLFSIGLVFIAVAMTDFLMGSSQRNIRLPEWLQGRREMLGVNVGVYRSFLIVVCGALARRPAGRPDAHPLRQPPARRRRRRPRGARARHPGRPGVRRDLRRRLGPGGPGRRARRRAAWASIRTFR